MAKSKSAFSFSRRAAGLLLHPTSLPGPHGCGDLGPAAHQFAAFLADAGLRWWQMLPIGPPDPTGSPYSCDSAFAGSPLLVNLDELVRRGLLERRDIAPPGDLARAKRVPYGATTRFRMACLRRAFREFASAGGDHDRAFLDFCERNAGWLDDFAFFCALRHKFGNKQWHKWPRGERLGAPAALRAARAELASHIAFHRFVQFEFDCQWSALRAACERLGVGLVGDIPIFVGHDSSDVWANRKLFTLNADGSLESQSGVPPDDFSATGQLWRHPLYRWPAHARDGFSWWIARFRQILSQFHAVRIDHFLGFARCWAVPGRDRIALHGKWRPTPGRELFAAVGRVLGRVEIIAEDLGHATPEALALRDRNHFPGMRTLHSAFGGDDGARYNQPHNFPRESVVYTGTHDNDTTVGWWKDQLVRAKKARRSVVSRLGSSRVRTDASAVSDWENLTTVARARRYLRSDGREIHWDMIRLALAAPSNTAIVPVQDVLGLDGSHRMNLPATMRGNWQWRFERGALTAKHARRLRELAEAYERCK